MNVPAQVSNQSSLQEFKPVATAPKASHSGKTIAQAAQADSLSFGDKLIHGSVQSAKAAVIPTVLVTAAALIASDPSAAGLAIFASPGLGVLGASAAGLMIGSVANGLGANKPLSATGGIIAGGAAGFALNKTGSAKARLMSAGAGAVIGGVAGYAGSGAKIDGNKLMNVGLGVCMGLVATAALSMAISRGKDINAAGTLITLAAAGAGGALVARTQPDP